MCQQKVDYVIAGGGAAGLQLAVGLSKHPVFKNKKVCIVEPQDKNTNDRTWCFWEEQKSQWDPHVAHAWQKLSFHNKQHHFEMTMEPYSYKMLRSGVLYENWHKQIKNNPNLFFLKEEVLHFQEKSDHVLVQTTHQQLQASWVFNSILDWGFLENQIKYPLLQQHFLGWFVKTDKDIFDPAKATFMDFSVPQKGNTRFMYVLPNSKNEALIEYTLFSSTLLPKQEYEEAIMEYLTDLGVDHYTITAKEQGRIPMTAFPFHKRNTKRILNIGAAGGWTKASTGFTFKNCERNTAELIQFLEAQNDFRNFGRSNRFRLYDLLFLDVLYHDNALGSLLFTRLFQRNKPQKIFRFLDEQTSFWEEIQIMTSFPPLLFLSALLKRLFR